MPGMASGAPLFELPPIEVVPPWARTPSPSSPGPGVPRVGRLAGGDPPASPAIGPDDHDSDTDAFGGAVAEDTAALLELVNTPGRPGLAKTSALMACTLGPDFVLSLLAPACGPTCPADALFETAASARLLSIMCGSSPGIFFEATVGTAWADRLFETSRARVSPPEWIQLRMISSFRYLDRPICSADGPVSVLARALYQELYGDYAGAKTTYRRMLDDVCLFPDADGWGITERADAVENVLIGLVH